MPAPTRTTARTLLLVVPACALAACTGVIDDPTSAGDGADDARRGGSTAPADSESCIEPAEIPPGPLHLRRLTQREYDNTVRDLLGDDSRPAYRFGSDGHEVGFDVNGNASVTRAQLEAFVEVSAELAERALAERGDEWLPCDRTRSACVEGFVRDFGLRAFRRPLDDQDVAGLLSLYESARLEWGADRAVEMVLEAMLLSPELLYHVELGTRTDDEGVVELDAWETASALSYFLWSTMPDDALFEAAASGELDTAAGIERHARRMIADPRADATLEAFFTQWLEVSPDVERDASLYPEWNAAIAEMLHQEVVDFTRRVVREEEGRFDTLLTASFTVGGPELAAWYRADAPDTGGRIELDPAVRAGVLTQAGVLASHAYPDQNAWVHRGQFIRERFLCDPIPPPPPDVDMSVLNNPDRLVDGQCAYCHQKMDPIGMGFDDYDPTGVHSPMAGPSHEDQGAIYGSEQLDVPARFDDPVELARALADSERVSDCFARQWFRFALQRHETEEEACVIAALRETFESSGGDIRELLVAIATAEAFRHRTTAEGE